MKVLLISLILTTCTFAHSGDTTTITLPDGTVMTCQVTEVGGTICWKS
jgi:hypothetical protein